MCTCTCVYLCVLVLNGVYLCVLEGGSVCCDQIQIIDVKCNS